MAILVLLLITLLGYLCDQGINPQRVSLLILFNFMADFKCHFHALLALVMPHVVWTVSFKSTYNHALGSFPGQNPSNSSVKL